MRFWLLDAGHVVGGRLSSMIMGGSCGRSRYSTTRSTELNSRSAYVAESKSRHALQVKLEAGPEAARPVDGVRERHGGGDADTGDTGGHKTRQCKEGCQAHSKSAKEVKVQ